MRLASTLIAVFVAATVLTGCSGAGDDTQPAAAPVTPSAAPETTAPAETSPPPPDAEPTPTPTPTRLPGTYMLGETSEEFAGGILTVQSVEVVQEIATTEGAPLTAAEGEQLVLFRTHFVNTGNGTVDLSCSGVHEWYVQVFDTERRELAPVFETYRIPGNQECNHELLSGQEADWVFAFRGIAGATPRVLQISDFNQQWIAWALTDEPLRLAD